MAALQARMSFLGAAGERTSSVGTKPQHTKDQVRDAVSCVTSRPRGSWPAPGTVHAPRRAEDHRWSTLSDVWMAPPPVARRLGGELPRARGCAARHGLRPSPLPRVPRVISGQPHRERFNLLYFLLVQRSQRVLRPGHGAGLNRSAGNRLLDAAHTLRGEPWAESAQKNTGKNVFSLTSIHFPLCFPPLF